MVLYGWWSDLAAHHNGYYVYKDPQGGPYAYLLVTCVSTNPKIHGTQWKDIIFKGEMTGYQCCGFVNKDGTFSSYGKKSLDLPSVQFRDIRPQVEVIENRAPSAPNDEITCKVIQNRTPCPLAYNGVGNCTCGKCPKPRAFDSNPFGY
jgi:hypothetical protein